MNPVERLAQIDRELAAATPRQTAVETLTAGRRFRLLADGDSWFDYALGLDIIDYLQSNYGHDVRNLAVGGSTLNELVYSLVPEADDEAQSERDPSRLAVVVDHIRRLRPQAFLFSGGGNDIAGPEFFPFVNHAASTLGNPNQDVLRGVVNGTFKKAYEDMVDTVTLAAQSAGVALPIFVHGYDYPWPDGRGARFVVRLAGPWFDGTFNQKGFPRKTSAELDVRRKIVGGFIDAMNQMLVELAAARPGVVHYIDLRGTIPSRSDWHNELHPRNAGFERIAAKFEAVLQRTIA